LNVISIALEYGFEYEQSYIRAFKKEFGLTPGELRKTGQIVKIKPPLQLFASNRYGDGLIFGPDIVMVPEFHVVGKRHILPLNDDIFTLVPKIFNQFIVNDYKNIPDSTYPDFIYNISADAGMGEGYCFIMPSIPVKSLENIPEGYDSYTFSTSFCARFSLIKSDNMVLDIPSAQEMFKKIDDFINNENQIYFLERKITIDKLYGYDYDNNLKLWEWFSPVIKKTEMN